VRFGGQAIDFEAPAYRTGDTTIIGPIRGYSIWRRAEAVLDDPQTGRHVVAWSAERDGFPDQYQFDHILEVEASVDEGDQGYSGWTQLEDGRIYVVAYTDDTAPPCPGSGADALGVAWIRGTYLSLVSDIRPLERTLGL